MIFVLKIRNVLMIFPDCLNAETFLSHQWYTQQFRMQIFRHIYIQHIKSMAADIDPTGRYETGKEDDKWDDNLMKDIRNRLEELRQFNAALETSSDKNITLDKNKIEKRYDKTGCKSNI